MKKQSLPAVISKADTLNRNGLMALIRILFLNARKIFKKTDSALVSCYQENNSASYMISTDRFIFTVLITEKGGEQ